MLFRLIGRLIIVTLGFALALLFGFAIMAYLGGQLLAQELAQQYGNEASGQILDFIGYIGFLVELYPAITLLPAILVVVIGEIGRLRSWMYYVLANGAASLMVPALYVASNESQRDLPSSSFLLIFATAGFGAGLVYWLIAGRKA